ncbi:MAG: hypothetical protein AB7O88_27245 [Reyranellaceae bacterium]
MTNPIPVYRQILIDFQEHKLAPDEFVRQYHEVFLNDDARYDKALWQVFNEAAGAAEFYTADPELIAYDPDLYIDEQELRKTVATVIEKLDKWPKA